VKKKKELTPEDKKVWENFTKQPSNIYDKDLDNNINNNQKYRFKFDLHGFTLNDANEKVKELILRCSNNNFKEILLITGKGLHSTTENDAYVSKDLSKLKYSVPDFINNNEINKYVDSISDALTKDGGEGAVLIKLKKFIK